MSYRIARARPNIARARANHSAPLRPPVARASMPPAQLDVPVPKTYVPPILVVVPATDPLELFVRIVTSYYFAAVFARRGEPTSPAGRSGRGASHGRR